MDTSVKTYGSKPGFGAGSIFAVIASSVSIALGLVLAPPTALGGALVSDPAADSPGEGPWGTSYPTLVLPPAYNGYASLPDASPQSADGSAVAESYPNDPNDAAPANPDTAASDRSTAPDDPSCPNSDDSGGYADYAQEPSDQTEQQANAVPAGEDPGNAAGNVQDCRDQPLNDGPPVVVMVPTPYYVPVPSVPVPAYPYYGPRLARRFRYHGAPQPVPPNVSLGNFAPPGYPFIGSSPMVPMRSPMVMMPPSSALMMRTFPMR